MIARALGVGIGLCACVLMTAGAGAPRTQQTSFSSRAEAVRVDVAVTRDGRPVTGLTADDFEVFDNGVRQQVTLLATDAVPLDLVLALDISGSLHAGQREQLRAGAMAALDALVPGEHAAVLTFTHRLSLRSALTVDRARLRASLDDEMEPGNTSAIDAAYAALVHADAGAGRALAVLFTDGVDTASWLTAPLVRDTARGLDAVLFVVSAGTAGGGDAGDLEDLASSTGGGLLRIRSTRELSTALQSLLQSFRQRYLLSYVPRGVARDGWHALDVRVKARGASVRARRGYVAS
jgi:VWFA-related protein